MNWTPIGEYEKVPQDRNLLFANKFNFTEGKLTWINFTSPKRWGVVDKEGRSYVDADDYTHYMEVELPK